MFGVPILGNMPASILYLRVMNRKHNKVFYVTPELAGEQSINFLNCCKMPPPSPLSLFPGFSCFPLSHKQQIRGKHTKINKAIELRSKEKELLSSSDRSVSVGAQIVALIQLLRGPVSVLCWMGSWKRNRNSSSKIEPQIILTLNAK